MSKKKIAVFGAGDAGKYLCDELQKRKKDYEILGFLDNYRTGEYRGIKIFIPKQYFDDLGEQTEAVILAAGAQKTLKIMIDTCREHGIRDLYMMHDIAGKCRLPLFDDKGMISSRIRKISFSDKAPTIAYFEVPVTDNCNLNCKGCLFASNVVSGGQHVSISEIESDAKRMSELFHDVPWIRILGGEPLMHPNITDILRCYRNYFKDSEIDLCTNGLLVPKMSDEFWECIRKERISVHISGYKPTYYILDKIDKILKEQKVPYVILRRDEFVKYYTDSPANDMKKSFERCAASGCYEVYRGHLSTCSAAIAFEKFNEYFNTSYELIEDEDWFDIHNLQIDIWKVTKTLQRASNMCRYCSDSITKSFPWEHTGDKVALTDYIL